MTPMTVQNTVLYKCFRNLSKKAIDILANSQAPIAFKYVRMVQRLRTAHVIGSSLEKDYVRYLEQHLSTILSTEEGILCLNELEKDSKVSRHFDHLVGAFTQTSRVTREATLRKFLMEFMGNLGQLKFIESIFNHSYLEMEDYLYGDKTRIGIFVPLENFHSELKEISLGNEWCILRIPEGRIIDLLNSSQIPELNLMSLTHALQWIGDVPKIILENGQKMKEVPGYSAYHSTIREIIAAMRIFKSGDFGFRYTEKKAIGWGFIGKGTSFHETRSHFGAPYLLAKEEVSALREFIEQYQSLKKDPALKVAISRLDYVFERDRYEDRIIDTMIAFEALFIEDRLELQYRLSLRVAACLYEFGSNRYDVYNDIRRAYQLRSRIVHGDSERKINRFLKRENINRKEFVERIVGYLREAMRAYMGMLGNGMDRESIIKQLDRLVTGEANES